MTFLEPFDVELANLESARVRRARQDWLRATTPVDVAQRLSRSFGLYDASPEVHLAFAQAGIDPVEDAEVWASVNAASQVVGQSSQVGVTGPASRLNSEPVLAQFDEAGTLVGFGGVGAKESDAMVRGITMVTTETDPNDEGYQTEDQLIAAIEAGELGSEPFLQLIQGEFGASKRPRGPGALENFQQTVAPIPVVGNLISEAAGTAPVRAAAGAVQDNGVTNFIQSEILGPAGRFARDNVVTTGVVQPVVRTGVSLLDFPYQATQAQFRTQYSRFREGGLGAFVPDEFSIDGVTDFVRETGTSYLEAGLQTQAGATAFDFGEELSTGGQQRTIEVGGRDVTATTIGRDNRLIGEGVNTGEGFFFGGEAEEFRRGAERSQGLINGRTITVGRWAASPLDAGSKPHTILSGLIDGALAIAGPGELAIDSTFKAFRAQRAFRSVEGGLPNVRYVDGLIDADSAEEVSSLLRSAGVREFTDEDAARLVRARSEDTVAKALAEMETPVAPSLAGDAAGSSLDAPPRRPSTLDLNAPVPTSAREDLFARWGALRGTRATVDPNLVRHFLDSRRGTRLAENMAGITDARQLDRMLGKSLPADRLAQYAAAETPDDIRRLLDADLGVQLSSKPGRGRLPHAIDRFRDFAPRQARLAGAVPSGFYDLDDSRRLLDTTQDVLVNTGANSRTLDYWHGRFTTAVSRRERFAALTEMTEEIGLRAAVKGAPDLEPKIVEWTGRTNAAGGANRIHLEDVPSTAAPEWVPGESVADIIDRSAWDELPRERSAERAEVLEWLDTVDGETQFWHASINGPSVRETGLRSADEVGGVGMGAPSQESSFRQNVSVTTNRAVAEELADVLRQMGLWNRGDLSFQDLLGGLSEVRLHSHLGNAVEDAIREVFPDFRVPEHWMTGRGASGGLPSLSKGDLAPGYRLDIHARVGMNQFSGPMRPPLDIARAGDRDGRWIVSISPAGDDEIRVLNHMGYSPDPAEGVRWVVVDADEIRNGTPLWDARRIAESGDISVARQPQSAEFREGLGEFLDEGGTRENYRGHDALFDEEMDGQALGLRIIRDSVNESDDLTVGMIGRPDDWRAVDADSVEVFEVGVRPGSISDPGRIVPMLDELSVPSDSVAILSRSTADPSQIEEIRTAATAQREAVRQARITEDEMWEAIRRNDPNPTGVEDIDAEIRTLRNGTKRLSTLFRDHLDRGRVYDLDYMSGNLIDTMVRTGEDTALIDRAAVHLQSEAINRLVPVPDSREMRRFFSNLRPILLNEEGGLRVSAKVYNAAIGVQSDIWKPAVLLRFAWPIRVVGEEQVRLAAGGYTSLINHPIQHLSVMMGNRKFLGRQLERLGYDIGDPTRRLVGDFASELHGERLALGDAHLQGMSTGSGRTFNTSKSPSFEVISTREVTARRAQEAWAGEMSKLAHDQVGVMILRSEDLDEAKRVFWENMESVRSDIRVGRPDVDVDVMTRAGADEYIDSVSDRINRLTNSNPELIDAMRSRGFEGTPMGGGQGQLNPAFQKKLGDFEESMPPFLPAREEISGGVLGSGRFDAFNQATEWMFTQLMGHPTDKLSRSPVFRQEYWREVQALAPRMRRADARRVVRAAEKANLPASEVEQLRRMVGRDVGGVPKGAVGTLDFNHVDNLAKAQALDRTQELLFDLSQRNQFFDVMSLIFPFGDAWMEVIGRWAKLAAEDPQVVRRASQAIEAGRDTGFIYENNNGEEVFNYPLSSWVTGLDTPLTPGVSVPLTGRVQGLSLATEVLPGIGPVAQLPLAAVVPNGPDWDWLREIAFPFGEPNVGDNPVNLVTDQFIPPAWRKIFSGLSGDAATPDEQRNYASTFGNIFAAAGSTGDYDVFNDNPTVARDEWQRLHDDSQESTGKFWTARGIFQLGAPSAPAPEWTIDDPDGTKAQIATLRELYGEAFEKAPENPIGYFLEEYGPWALAAVQGRTVAIAPGRGLPPTKEAEEWARRNPELGDEFKLVYGFFAPQGGDFDYQAYSRILDRGERVPLTEEQQVTRFLHTLGSFEYTREKERIEGLAIEQGWDGEGLLPLDGRRYLAEYDEWLTDKYGTETGGYGGRQNRWSGPGTASVDEALAQLRDAVEDDRLVDHPVAVASRDMFEIMGELDRRFSEDNPEQSDAASWHTSKAGSGYREFMVATADYWVKETPEFAQVFEAVFEPVIRQGLLSDEQETE